MWPTVNDKGEVTVEGQFVGKLRDSGSVRTQDKMHQPRKRKPFARHAFRRWHPQFHLRADRFYNAPDTEIDFTEQCGLMWGAEAVGKLVASQDPLKPTVVAFVDDEAGTDVAEKVQRRLQHFIDRKIATAFEPMLKMNADEALEGLAKGFAFRCPKASVWFPVVMSQMRSKRLNKTPATHCANMACGLASSPSLCHCF